MERHTGPDGRELYVDESESERGSRGPFHVVYTVDSPDPDERWGFFCTNCGTFNNAVDTMGRIECNDCHNVRKPDEWDATTE